MKILVIGSGGREHALAWKISQSPMVKKLYCAPGNTGMTDIAGIVPINADDMSGLVNFASHEKIDLTVVGPELPLTLGIVDEFEKKGLKIFGPNKSASQLEGSKVFAKQFMSRHKIPTARYRIAYSLDKAEQILKSGEFSFPLIIKVDGLAAGKGSIKCGNSEKAMEVLDSIMVKKKFGDSGNNVVIEEFLNGKEASFIVLSDGAKILPLVTTMDHKAVFDGDNGPNTGGMGAISPSPFIGQEMFNDIIKDIVFPTVTRMLEEGKKYKGVLYVGLMLTKEGPKVLEYNCRFGDPETQAQILRMDSDIVDILLGIVEGNILEKKSNWIKKPSACVVVASGGYPTKYEKGKIIEGMDKVSKIPGITIFHAKTKFEHGQYFTNGGRVLGVCASENTLEKTMNKIYYGISKISFEEMHYRKDIGSIQKEKQ